MNFVKFLRTTIFIEHFRCLLLNLEDYRSQKKEIDFPENSNKSIEVQSIKVQVLSCSKPILSKVLHLLVSSILDIVLVFFNISAKSYKSLK